MNDEINVIQLKEKLDANHAFTILDVREIVEIQVGKLEPSLHIPMNDVPSRFNELDPDREYAILCRGGNRSRMVTDFLKNNDFTKVFNVAGGITAWSLQIDPNVKVG